MKKIDIIAWFISLIKVDIKEFKLNENDKNSLYKKIKASKENDNEK